MAIKPTPTTEKPIAYSGYFNTPKSIRAIPNKVRIKDDQANIEFLLRLILNINFSKKFF